MNFVADHAGVIAAAFILICIIIIVLFSLIAVDCKGTMVLGLLAGLSFGVGVALAAYKIHLHKRGLTRFV